MASEYTENYNLDLYVDTDKPNLRDQYNSAVRKIDQQLKTDAVNITTAQNTANDAHDIAKQAQADVAAEKTERETAVNEVKALITDETTARENADTVINNTITEAYNTITEAYKAADNAIIEAYKAADNALIESFKLPEKAVADNTIQNANFKDLTPLSRINFGTAGNNYAMQKCCIISENFSDSKIYAVYYEKGETDGVIVTYNGSQRISTVNAFIGHDGGMIFDNNSIVALDNVNKRICTIPCTAAGRLSNAVNYQPFTGSGAIAKAGNKIYMVSSTAATELDITSLTVGNTISLSNNNEPAFMPGTGQSSGAFEYKKNIYFWRNFSNPNYIDIFGNDGNFIARREVAAMVDYAILGELEGMAFDEYGNFVLVANEGSHQTGVLKTGITACGNIESKENYDFTNSVQRMGGNGVFIACNSANPDFVTKGAGEVNGSNVLNVKYFQDVQGIVNTLKDCSCEVSIESDMNDQVLAVTGANVYLDFKSHTTGGVYFRECCVKILNSSVHIAKGNYITDRGINFVQCPIACNMSYSASNSKENGMYASNSTCVFNETYFDILKNAGNIKNSCINLTGNWPN